GYGGKEREKGGKKGREKERKGFGGTKSFFGCAKSFFGNPSSVNVSLSRLSLLSLMLILNTTKLGKQMNLLSIDNHQVFLLCYTFRWRTLLLAFVGRL
ncbi:hypothetical protein Dsin_017376, partial [Dipteronia sinensis]